MKNVLRAVASVALLWLTSSITLEVGPCTPAAYTVTSTTDNGTGTTPGTLSRAVAQALAANCAGSEVNFSVPNSSTITLPKRILINGPVTINRPGASNLTISGGGTTRIFFVNPGSGVAVNINNLTLADGYGMGGSSYFGGAAAGMGGAIFQYTGTLNLSGIVLSGNTALGALPVTQNGYLAECQLTKTGSHNGSYLT
jgi:hypothetical protein